MRISLPSLRAGNRPLSMCRLTVRSQTCQRVATSLMLNHGDGMSDLTTFITVSLCQSQAANSLKDNT
jgi:hypothetical protein